MDISVLKSATESFKKAIDEYSVRPSEFVRDSKIQRFEYCYDLATKYLKRYLSETSSDPSSVDTYTFQEIIRKSYTQQIIQNSWDVWRKYRDNRNKTSHGYNESNAIEIANKTGDFYAELCFMIEQLEKKISDHENRL